MRRIRRHDPKDLDCPPPACGGDESVQDITDLRFFLRSIAGGQTIHPVCSQLHDDRVRPISRYETLDFRRREMEAPIQYHRAGRSLFAIATLCEKRRLANTATFLVPHVETRKSRKTSPNFATLSESPIIKTLFIIGTSGAERFFSLGAATTNTTSTRASTSASGLSNARASADQSIRAVRAGIFVFIFYLDVRLQID